MLSLHKTGCALALFIGGWHLAWVALVASGTAQALLNFVFLLHFITPPYTVETFSPVPAAVLVGLAFIAGYVVGVIFAVVWNFVHRRQAPALLPID